MNRTLVAVLAALGAASVSAAPLHLGNYRVTGNFALERGANDIGWEATAVTYAGDRTDPFTNTKGTLFFIGDEGRGVVEVSRTGQTIGSMTFTGGMDTEGLTYLGGNQLVIVEERLQDALRFTYGAGGSLNLPTAPRVSIDVTVGNIGTEGISYDPKDGSFVSVKQDNPQKVLAGTLDFTTGVSTMVPLFDPDTLLGLNSLSDVQTLSAVKRLAGTAEANNLLLLSLDSRRLVEVNRSGTIISSLDLSFLFDPGNPNNIEGLTIDENGTIYLVAEHEQSPESDNSRSRLIELRTVPVPGTLALMLGGLGALAWRTRRKD
jgi:uncharacterized protein YjiK